MAEEWRAVDGVPYEVSSEGRVRREGGRVLAGRKHTNGYVRVFLGAKREAYVHRLVCAAFNGRAPSDDSHTDHINSDRADNRAANLRWLSPAENRALRKFRRGEGHSNAKLTERDVRAIRSGALEKIKGISPRTIRDARSGKSWNHVQ